MKINKIILFLLFFILCLSCVHAQNLHITSLNKKNASGIILEFNNSLELYELKIEQINNTAHLILPYYKKGNSQYSYFSFLDRNFKNDIIYSIQTNAVSTLKAGEITYKINKFKLIQNAKTIKAGLSVIFNDLLEVNASIMYGKYGLFVQWPSKKQNDKWKKLFIIKDKELKKKLENDILQVYNLKNADKTNGKYKK